MDFSNGCKHTMLDIPESDFILIMTYCCEHGSRVVQCHTIDMLAMCFDGIDQLIIAVLTRAFQNVDAS